MADSAHTTNTSKIDRRSLIVGGALTALTPIALTDAALFDREELDAEISRTAEHLQGMMKLRYGDGFEVNRFTHHSLSDPSPADEVWNVMIYRPLA